MMSRGRQDIRSHLDDLAQRHPEFADHLRCPPWGGEVNGSSRGTWGRKRRGSGSSGDDNNAGGDGETQGGEPSPSRGRSRPSNLPQYGLRNTVDLGQQQKQHKELDSEKIRGQRSWSAPPDSRNQNPPDPPRYVSRLDINPLSSGSCSGSSSATDQGKPPVAPKQSQTASAQSQHSNAKQNQGGNVRHIPIFVEGRDEPLLPKDTESASEKIFPEKMPQQQQYSSFAYSRPSHFAHNVQQTAPQSPPSNQHFMNNDSTFTMPSKPQEKQQAQQMPKSHQEHIQKPSANDPISRVQCVHMDVEELRIKVEEFKGASRRDKEYMYLDEMLTRNLLKLDDIDTEGKENVRQARKDVIKEIQKCISILESKVPSADISEDTEMASINDFKTLSLPADQNSPDNTQKLKVGSADRDEIPLDGNISQVSSCPVHDNESVVDVHVEGSILENVVSTNQAEDTDKQSVSKAFKEDLVEMPNASNSVSESVEKMDVQFNKCNNGMLVPDTSTKEAAENTNVGGNNKNTTSSRPVAKLEKPSNCSSKEEKHTL